MAKSKKGKSKYHKVKDKAGVILVVLSLIFSSCCPFIKEENLVKTSFFRSTTMWTGEYFIPKRNVLAQELTSFQ